MAICLYILIALLFVFATWILFEKKMDFPKFMKDEADVWGMCHLYLHLRGFAAS